MPDDPARLLVVDQLEELFTRCDDPERRSAFVAALLERRGPVAVGLRADLYGRLGAHPELAQAVAGDQVLLGAMTRAELERAVTAPAALAGLKLEPGLTELIVRDVATEPGALPMLSHALRATWELRDGRTLTVDGYRRSGGVASAIARTADALVDALPPEQRALARGVFLRMTELGEGADDSRRRVPTAELVPEGTDAATVAELLARLADARLVTLGDDDAEVAHEALIREWPRLRGWLEEDRDAIRAHRRLGDAAALWEAGGRDPSDLLRGARLAAAVEVAEAGRVQLNAVERAFVDAGAEQAERERRAEQRANRRLRGLLAGAVVLLVVAIAAGLISLAQRGQAQDAEAAAEAQALRADAERLGALGVAAPRHPAVAAAGRRGRRAPGPARDTVEPAHGAAAQSGRPRDPRDRAGRHHGDGRRARRAACWSRATTRGRCGSRTCGRGRRPARRSGSRAGWASSRWRSRPTAGASRSASNWPTATRCTSSTWPRAGRGGCGRATG